MAEGPNISATICQAALATFATTFFASVSIGNRSFADGGLGVNNPIDEVEAEAAMIWCSEAGDLRPLVRSFISIGTGNPANSKTHAFEDSLAGFLGPTIIKIATEAKNTEKRFRDRWTGHSDEKRYYRFNLDQSLEIMWYEEYRNQGAVKAATKRYLNAQNVRVQDCIQDLKTR